MPLPYSTMNSVKVNLEPEIKKLLLALAKESGDLSLSQTVNLIVLKYLTEEKKITMEQFKEYSTRGRHTWQPKSFQEKKELIDKMQCSNGI